MILSGVPGRVEILPDQQCTKLVKYRGGIISIIRTVALELHMET